MTAAPEVVMVEVVALLYVDAVDMYDSELDRRGKALKTRDTYGRTLREFAEALPQGTTVREITTNDVRRFLARFNHLSPATKAGKDSHLRGFFEWLFVEGDIKAHPMARMLPPKRQRDEDKDVVTVTPAEVRQMLEAAQGWTERLTIAVLAYMGPRRSAAANLRVSDYDPVSQRLKFKEKGSKTTWKPVPAPLAQLIEESLGVPRSLGWKLDKGRWVHRGYRPVEPDDYLIPSATSHRKPNRDNRIIANTVNKVADRCGIKATPHAFRRAFAVYFLETHNRDTIALQELMGHQNFETTRGYLRRLDRGEAMETVRDLDWGSLSEREAKPATQESELGEHQGVSGSRSENELPANSEEKIQALLEAEKEGFEPSILTPLGRIKANRQREAKQ